MYPTAGNISKERFQKAMDAKEFFMKMLNAPIDYIAVENPTPLNVVSLPKHTQLMCNKKTLLPQNDRPVCL